MAGKGARQGRPHGGPAHSHPERGSKLRPSAQMGLHARVCRSVGSCPDCREGPSETSDLRAYIWDRCSVSFRQASVSRMPVATCDRPWFDSGAWAWDGRKIGAHRARHGQPTWIEPNWVRSSCAAPGQCRRRGRRRPVCRVSFSSAMSDPPPRLPGPRSGAATRWECRIAFFQHPRIYKCGVCPAHLAFRISSI